MQKHITLAGLLLSLSFALFSQTPANIKPPPNISATFKPQTFDQQVFLIDANGKPFNRDYSNVNGSPFLMDNFKPARLVLAGGKTVDSVQVRLDIEKQELHYLAANNEFVVSPGKVVEINFVENAPVERRQFKCGYPKIDNQDEHSFYEVLAEGPVTYLKSRRKVFLNNKNEMSGEIEQRFEMYEEDYVIAKNDIKRLKKDKDFILNLLSDQREKVEAYSKANQLGWKTSLDLQKIFLYYNSLPRP